MKIPANVDPNESWIGIKSIANQIVNDLGTIHHHTAMVMTETSLTIAFIERLRLAGIKCFVATTNREMVETVKPDGTVVKTAIFKFVQFRMIG